ncbi:MAG: TIGR01906 family membrane protein [Clostridiales bacterium]|nr:TIGR01906 family membrane protein [Clostridiales bacterium]
MHYRFNPKDCLLGLLFLLLFIGIGLNIAIFFRPLYYWDISFLSLEEHSGLVKEEILANYNALIDYCSPFFFGALTLPSLLVSPDAIEHFAKVKIVFGIFDFLAICSFVILIIDFLRKRKQITFSQIFTWGITTLAVPILLGVCCAFFWEKTFIYFHKIFFPGDYWLFDWNADSIIRILPDTFFLQCAVLIIGIVMLGGFLLLLYSFYIRSTRSKYS